MKIQQPLFSIFIVLLLSISLPCQAREEVLEFDGKVEIVNYGEVNVPFYDKAITKVRVADKLLFVFPGVIVPTVHGALLLEHTTIYHGEDVLDIGTGCGVQGIFAAEKARWVLSTDIDLQAVENARLNAKLHKLDNIIEVRAGDLFSPVKPTEKFDVILFNIDAPYSPATQGLWKVHERFFKEVKNYMKPDARIYYQSHQIDNIAHIDKLVDENHLQIMSINMLRAPKLIREPFVMVIKRNPRFLEQ